MVRLFPLFASLPVTAAAHPGSHLHPHGVGLGAVLLVGVLVTALMLSRRFWK